MKELEMVKCESLRINMFRITHTGKVSKFSRNKGEFRDLKTTLQGVQVIVMQALGRQFSRFVIEVNI